MGQNEGLQVGLYELRYHMIARVGLMSGQFMLNTLEARHVEATLASLRLARFAINIRKKLSKTSRCSQPAP